MPAKESLTARARVTAGLANEVDAVNQYAAVMYAATAKGTALGRRWTHSPMMRSSPNVATISLAELRRPVPGMSEKEKIGPLEHEVRDRGPEQSADYLRRDVRGNVSPWELSDQRRRRPSRWG